MLKRNKAAALYSKMGWGHSFLIISVMSKSLYIRFAKNVNRAKVTNLYKIMAKTVNNFGQCASKGALFALGKMAQSLWQKLFVRFCLCRQKKYKHFL